MTRQMMEKVLVGIDEAGRGPLAGPVSVGVFVVRSRNILRKFKGIKDSKQLSEKQREEWLKKIKKMRVGSSSGSSLAQNFSNNWQVAYAVSFSSAGIIDRKGISYAVRSAINRSLNRLERDGFLNEKSRILLDGLLHAHPRFVNQKTIINGDATEAIIALASICAKVHRDRRMKTLAKQFPNYSLEVHKGYGTEAHYKAIKKHGISEIHRKSYLKRVV